MHTSPLVYCFIILLKAVCRVQEFQTELQQKEFEIAAVKTKVNEILKSHANDSPGYKELKKQKHRLGTTMLTLLT